MAKIKKKKKAEEKKYFATVDPNMKNHIDDPYFVKKAEEAKAFLKRVGLPEGWGTLEEL
jgi:hypothetical protein